MLKENHKCNWVGFKKYLMYKCILNYYKINFLFPVISKMKIKEKPTPPKATFLRKSAFMATGNDSFRFNFELAPDEVDKGDITRPAYTSNIANLSSGHSQVPKKEININEPKFNFTGSKFKFNFNIAE